jgi:hypothetical protein
MANKNFFNGSDHLLYTGAQNFAAKVAKNPQQYGLSSEQLSEFQAASTSYGTAYLAAIDPETRTKSKVAAKNAAKRSLKSIASDLAKVIDGTPSVTAEMKIDLGLNVRKHPSPNPPPTVRPAITIVGVTGRTVTIKIRQTGESSRRGKPAGVLGASVYTFVGTNYPTDPMGWTFDGTTTKTTHKIVFADNVPNGAQIWVCAAWFNRKTETGPVSIPVTTNIQGGLGGAMRAEEPIKIAA